MSELIASSELSAIVGMGATGLSVARFLSRRKQRFFVLDTRTAPPGLEQFKQHFPAVPFELGEIAVDKLLSASRIVLSPGLSPEQAAIAEARNAGVPVVGDIQLFADAVEAPLVAITGSNGKSTVTTLVGEMLKAAGKQTAVGGNLGTPALDLIAQDIECYVLEVSSFQLESATKLNAQVACLLNVSADHLDRHRNMADYHAIKQRVFFGARHVVVNRDDPLTQPPLRSDMNLVSFGLDRPDLKQFGEISHEGRDFLAFGLNKLIAASEVRLAGRHNLANALAALAIGHCLDLPMGIMLNTLRTFPGLPHRCQWVGSKNGVDFFDDSKGTNVGASLAALQGLSRLPGKLVLIAGGEGKGADFWQLAEALRENVRTLVSIGVDGPKIAAVAEQAGVRAIAATGMDEAVEKAFASARSGDAVLLSPACASFDMFKDYMDRGRQFVAAVGRVIQ